MNKKKKEIDIPVYGRIYKIKNDINNKIYIGQTTHPINVRWNYHLQRARNHSQESGLYKDIHKYGSKHFAIFEIEKTNDLNEREQYWIKHYDCKNPKKGYNQKKGGAGHNTDDEKLKLILKQYHEGVSIIQISKNISCDKRYVSRFLHSIGISDKETEAHANNTKRKVAMIDVETGDVLQVFPSIKAAGVYIKDYTRAANIRKVLNGQRKSAWGYYWEEVDEN